MEEIVTKLEQGPAPNDVEEAPDRDIRIRVEAESLEKLKKRADVRLEAPHGSSFSIVCDEGPFLGGDDTAPAPLQYWSAAIAF